MLAAESATGPACPSARLEVACLLTAHLPSAQWPWLSLLLRTNSIIARARRQTYNQFAKGD